MYARHPTSGTGAFGEGPSRACDLQPLRGTARWGRRIRSLLVTERNAEPRAGSEAADVSRTPSLCEPSEAPRPAAHPPLRLPISTWRCLAWTLHPAFRTRRAGRRRRCRSRTLRSGAVRASGALLPVAARTVSSQLSDPFRSELGKLTSAPVAVAAEEDRHGTSTPSGPTKVGATVTMTRSTRLGSARNEARTEAPPSTMRERPRAGARGGEGEAAPSRAGREIRCESVRSREESSARARYLDRVELRGEASSRLALRVARQPDDFHMLALAQCTRSHSLFSGGRADEGAVTAPGRGVGDEFRSERSSQGGVEDDRAGLLGEGEKVGHPGCGCATCEFG